jgi:succinate-semialdehyde dehydrogenase/glutarate-semialdehyde dehydrogenase
MFLSINPFTETILFEKPFQSPKEYSEILKNTYKAQNDWQKIDINDKIFALKTLSNQLLVNKSELAQTITNEIGKNIHEAEAEIIKCIDTIDYYCINAKKLLESESITNHQLTGTAVIQPLGVIFAIMPWNFPIWQCMRVIIPALIIGNGVVIKPAPNAGLTSNLLINLIQKSLHSTVINIIWCDVLALENIISNPIIKACTLTGSEKAGRNLAMLSGKYLKKCVLELGGSDPFIILEDIEIENVVKSAITARIQNNGQSCIASKRFIIPKSIYNTFKLELIKQLEHIEYKNPLFPNHSIGPIARFDLKIHLENQVKNAIESGAQLVYQSNKLLPNKNYFPITVLENLNPNTPAHTEEFFGPVFNLYTYANLEEAITLSNNTPFGLGASIWTNNITLAKQIAYKIDAGNVFINTITRSDAAIPFGGIKNSGFGKELGKEGLLEFAHIKYIQQLM